MSELLTTSEVCERLRVTRQTVWRWRKAGLLPAIVIGGTVRFKAVDVDALLLPGEAS
jgi:excisionase family DNA binding protein